MMGEPFYSDQDILNGIKNSVHAVEKTFYDQNYDMIRGLVKKMDSSRNIDIDDLYQEVMVVVFMRIKSNELTQLTAKLSTYVYKIAHNLLLYKLRKNSRVVTSTLEDQDIADEEATDNNIKLETLEITALEMVKKLAYPCNEIIEDWYIHKLDYDQIAQKYRYKNANTAKKKKGDCMTHVRERAKELLRNFSS
jgi:RNA polymerase sigma factor (sigma-70 family)